MIQRTILYPVSGNIYYEAMRSQNQNENRYDTLKIFTVIIPYSDNTLKKNIGKDKFGERQLFYSIELKCEDEKKAIELAKSEFNESNISKPIYPNKKEVYPKIEQNDNKIIIKKDFKVTKKE